MDNLSLFSVCVPASRLMTKDLVRVLLAMLQGYGIVLLDCYAIAGVLVSKTGECSTIFGQKWKDTEDVNGHESPRNSVWHLVWPQGLRCLTMSHFTQAQQAWLQLNGGSSSDAAMPSLKEQLKDRAKSMFLGQMGWSNVQSDGYENIQKRTVTTWDILTSWIDYLIQYFSPTQVHKKTWHGHYKGSHLAIKLLVERVGN